MLTLSCIHTTSPWLCKKGDKYVVWILNNLVHMITVPTTLIPRFPSENVIHYADLIWIFAKLSQGEVIFMRSSLDSRSSHNILGYGDLVGRSVYIIKCLNILHHN